MEPNLKALSADYRLQEYHLTHFSRLTAEQAEQVRQWRNHPDVRQWMYQDHEISPEEHARFMKGQQQPTHSSFWLLRDADEPLGVLGFNSIDWRNENGYWAFYAKPGITRKGIGKMMDALACHVFFSELKLFSLKLTVFVINERVIHIHEKFGFKSEGILRAFAKRNDAYVDVLIMGMTRTEYELLPSANLLVKE